MLVKDNAYLILGLQSDADDGLINKRYHELEKIAKVGLNKKYQNDLSFINYKNLRSESDIKNAFHNLTDQNNKIYNFFFWFNLSDEKNLEIFNLYKSGQIEESLKKWESEYIKTNDLNYLMNYIIGGLLALELDNNLLNQQFFKELTLSIPTYLTIVFDSNDFFNNLYLRYNSCSSIGIGKTKIREFRASLPQYVCEQFFTLGEKHGTFYLYKGICENYNISSKNIEATKKVADEHDNLVRNSISLKRCHVPEDVHIIIGIAKRTLDSVKELSSLGIRDNPKIGKLRDEIASSLLDFSHELSKDAPISLFGEKINTSDDNLEILNLASEIAYSNRIKKKISIYNENTKKNDNVVEKGNSNNNDNKKDKKNSEIDSLISSIYLSFDVIKDPKLLGGYSKLVDEIRKTHSMVKKLDGNNDLDYEHVVKIKDDFGMAILAAATKYYDETGDYVKTSKLLELAKSIAKSRGILTKITVETHRIDDAEKGLKVNKKDNSTDKKDERNNLISSIYLLLEVIKNPGKLESFSKLLDQISKVNEMIKKLESDNSFSYGHICNIRDNIGEAVSAAAIRYYTEKGDYRRASKLFEMAKKISRSWGTINKIINEIHIMDESENKLNGKNGRSSTYSQSNIKSESNKPQNNKPKTDESKESNQVKAPTNGVTAQSTNNSKSNNLSFFSIIGSIFKWIFKIIKGIFKGLWGLFCLLGFRGSLFLIFFVIGIIGSTIDGGSKSTLNSYTKTNTNNSYQYKKFELSEEQKASIEKLLNELKEKADECGISMALYVQYGGCPNQIQTNNVQLETTTNSVSNYNSNYYNSYTNSYSNSKATKKANDYKSLGYDSYDEYFRDQFDKNKMDYYEDYAEDYYDNHDGGYSFDAFRADFYDDHYGEYFD